VPISFINRDSATGRRRDEAEKSSFRRSKKWVRTNRAIG
jgi:hypothetical protein